MIGVWSMLFVKSLQTIQSYHQAAAKSIRRQGWCMLTGDLVAERHSVFQGPPLHMEFKGGRAHEPFIP